MMHCDKLHFFFLKRKKPLGFRAFQNKKDLKLLKNHVNLMTNLELGDRVWFHLQIYTNLHNLPIGISHLRTVPLDQWNKVLLPFDSSFHLLNCIHCRQNIYFRKFQLARAGSMENRQNKFESGFRSG